MRSARVLAVAGLVAAVTAGMAGPAQASAGSCPPGGQEGLSSKKVWYRFGDITEAVLRVQVPVERVRGLVPDDYTLLGQETGTATLLAAHGSVEKLGFGCSGGTPATVSEYGVMIESPDPKDLTGRHAYYVSLLTDSQALISRLATLGAPVKFAHGRFDVQSDSGNVQIAARETWDGGAVELDATATEPAAGPIATLPGVRFWFDGPRGTIRTAYECPSCRPRTPASGWVFGSGGSAVETILEGNRAGGSGFFIRTTLTATAELNYLDD